MTGQTEASMPGKPGWVKPVWLCVCAAGRVGRDPLSPPQWVPRAHLGILRHQGPDNRGQMLFMLCPGAKELSFGEPWLAGFGLARFEQRASEKDGGKGVQTLFGTWCPLPSRVLTGIGFISLVIANSRSPAPSLCPTPPDWEEKS